jgi:hypothetical protein
MLVFKAQQVIAATAVANKPYSFEDERGKTKSGNSIYSDVTVLSSNGSVAVIRIKGKTEEEVKSKVAKLAVGKAAEVEIRPDESTRGVCILNAM